MGGCPVEYTEDEIIDSDHDTPHEIKKIITRIRRAGKFQILAPFRTPKEPFVACKEHMLGLRRLLNKRGHLYSLSPDGKKLHLCENNVEVIDLMDAPESYTLTSTQREDVWTVIERGGRWASPGPEHTWEKDWNVKHGTETTGLGEGEQGFEGCSGTTESNNCGDGGWAEGAT